MISRKQFWIIALPVLAVALLAGGFFGQGWAHHDRELGHAAWEKVFDNPRGLVRGVDTVVLAQAVSVAPGRVAYSDQEEDALPFQVWQFEVVHGVKGAGSGETVLVERAGGVDPGGHRLRLDADGGEFEVGQVYLLFLNQQPDGPYYYQVNHQGRFRVAGDRLEAVAPHDPVATRFHGRPVSEVVSFVRAAAGPVQK
jgi:hypothetical protein